MHPCLLAQSYRLADRNILQFKDAWTTYDPKATQFIETSKLLPLLQNVDFPLGLNNART